MGAWRNRRGTPDPDAARREREAVFAFSLGVVGGLVVGAVLGASFAWAPFPLPEGNRIWPPILAASFGALAAIAGLLSMFKDNPFQILQLPSGQLYILVHIGAGLFAWLVIDEQTFAEGLSPWLEGVIAGVSGPVLVRLRMSGVGVGDAKGQIGPGALVDSLIETLSADIDRKRAVDRARIVRDVMRGVDFDKSSIHAVSSMISSREIMSSEHQVEIWERVDEIRDSIAPPQVKSDALGYLILDNSGEDFLRAIFTSPDRDNPSDTHGVFIVDDPDDEARYKPSTRPEPLPTPATPIATTVTTTHAIPADDSGWFHLDTELFGTTAEPEATPADTPGARTDELLAADEEERRDEGPIPDPNEAPDPGDPVLAEPRAMADEPGDGTPPGPGKTKADPKPKKKKKS